MNDMSLSETFVFKARRLIRFRFVLVGALLLNCVMIARVPLLEMRASVGRAAIADVPPSPVDAMHDEQPSTAPATPTTPDPVAPSPVVVVQPPVPPATAPTAAQLPAHPLAQDAPPVPAPAQANSTPHPSGPDGMASPPQPLPGFSWQAWKHRAHSAMRNAQHALHDQVQAQTQWLASLERRVADSAAPRMARAVPAPSWPTHRTATAQSEPAGDGLNEPANGSDTQTPALPNSGPQQLVLHNPLENIGPIHYLLDGRVCTLEPGEQQILRAHGPRHIRFDRGRALGVESQTIESGPYHFIVNAEQGWQLMPIGP